MRVADGVKIAAGVAAVAIAGTAYVVVHEQRRKLRTERRAAAAAVGPSGSEDGPLPDKAKLIAILEQSSTAASQLIDQTRKMVHKKHEETGIPLDKCVEELQHNFENAMETVVYQIRKNHGVSEPQMSAAMNALQHDAEVQQALATLRDAMSGKAPPSPPKVEDDAAARMRARRAKARNKK